MRVATYLGIATLVLGWVTGACIPNEKRNFVSAEAGASGATGSDPNTTSGGQSSGGHSSAGAGTGGEAPESAAAGGADDSGTSGTGTGGNAPSCLLGDVRLCSEGGLSGPCATGQQSCRVDGTWSACTVAPKAADSCVQGNDDNCNGIPNEDCDCFVGDTRPCAEDGAKGNCAAGTQACQINGTWGECSIAAAAADTCEPGDDANCNGTKNDNPQCECLAGSTRSCADGEALGNCASGEQTCEQGQWSPCTIEPASSDTCEPGDDANCNGVPNEGCDCDAGDTQDCGSPTDVGECQYGTSTCMDGGWGQCVGAIPPATRDCTSQADNDCDGVPDDYQDDVCQCRLDETRACDSHPGDGRGSCRAGSQECVFTTNNATSHWGDCTGSVGPSVRNCASSDDDDCDGKPDNTLDTVCRCSINPIATQPCETHDRDGVGICRAGSQSCVPGENNATSDWGACQGSVGPEAETCAPDGRDEDCDGRVNQYDPCPRVLDIGAGRFHTCALLADGTVRCWGDNEFGQLGNGSNISSVLPVEVSSLTDATAISVTGFHTCALLSNKTVRCWGHNKNGQLGDNSTDHRNAPVQVSGLTNVSAVATGGYHSCALLGDGSVRCWGDNGGGRLGNGSTDDQSTPVLVSGSDTWAGATSLVLGGNHSCAKLGVGNGPLRCWGANASGQLGDGTSGDDANKTTPVAVTTLSNYVTNVLAAGGSHTCARVNVSGSTSAQCWGKNEYGQLGNGSTADESSPVEALNLKNAIQLEAGFGHTCAIVDDRTARCWGYNEFGQLGDGTTTHQSTAVAVSGLTNVAVVSAGYHHTCAVLSITNSDGSVYCWGQNEDGQLGDGTTTDRPTPVRVLGP